jgi:hypothetical protein
MKKILFLSLMLFFGITAHSQACGDAFTDPGGPTGNFANNTDYTVTICPTNPGDIVTVTFTAFSMEFNFDALYVFNGNSISAPQIASANGPGNIPGGLAGGYSGNNIPGPFTSTSPDGCLTFRFRSDNSIVGPGWIANVTCGPPPSCTTPTNLAVGTITHNSATFNWTQLPNPDTSVASAWECIVLPAGSPAPTGGSAGFVNAFANPFDITGLTALTCYTCYVRAVCSLTDKSDWSAGVNFCTLIAPPVCGGQFTDNGIPPNYNYSNNANTTTTICPTNPGDAVTVVFNSFNTETNFDALYVYDGNSTAAAQIPSLNGPGSVPGGLAGGFWGNTLPGSFTSSSPDGCLTFRFRSDGSVTAPGWVADIICTPNPDKVILRAFVDTNSNGIMDAGEALFSNGTFIYQQNNDGINVNGYSPTGQYVLYDSNPANTYSFSYQIQSQFTPYYSSGTTTYNNISIPTGSGTQIFYFPISLTQSYNDVAISLIPLGPARPGYTYANYIRYKNQGVATASGTITFVKPPQITSYSTPQQTGTVMNPTGFTYDYTNLQPNETRGFYVSMTIPAVPTVNINDLLSDSASITSTPVDFDLTNNSSFNSQIVVNSFDPNDKMESRGKTIPFNQFAPDDYFVYTIRFQNNGTADAIDVRIEDLLNPQIDETTLQMVASSHNYTMKRINNHLVWDFKNIYLVPSGVDENGSRGYVQFKVKLKPGFQAGDIIPNNASIYFDSNPAIVTATFNSKFTVPLSVSDFDANSLVLYPNPATNLVQIDLVGTNEQLKKVVFYDLLGKAVKVLDHIGSERLSVDISNLSKGVYLVEISTSTHLKQIKKLIIH